MACEGDLGDFFKFSLKSGYMVYFFPKSQLKHMKTCTVIEIVKGEHIFNLMSGLSCCEPELSAEGSMYLFMSTNGFGKLCKDRTSRGRVT